MHHTRFSKTFNAIFLASSFQNASEEVGIRRRNIVHLIKVSQLECYPALCWVFWWGWQAALSFYWLFSSTVWRHLTTFVAYQLCTFVYNPKSAFLSNTFVETRPRSSTELLKESEVSRPTSFMDRRCSWILEGNHCDKFRSQLFLRG